MRPEVVKAVIALLLAKNGLGGTGTWKRAAERIGVSRSHVCDVAICRERSARVQAGLARLCRRRPSELFGKYVHPELARDDAAEPKGA